MASPIIPQPHSPADVVRPLIWLRELNSMELPLIIATDTTEAAEIAAKFSLLYAMIERSIIAATAEDMEIRINVLSPAECRLLDLSQPMNEAKITDKNILNKIE